MFYRLFGDEMDVTSKLSQILIIKSDEPWA